MMGAIFVTDCGNLLHDQSRIRQIRFLPERRARIQLRLQTTEAARNSAKPDQEEPALVCGGYLGCILR
jgi:hypothetical protein